MALTDGDKAEILVIATEAAERIIEKVLMAHVLGCPIGRSLATKLAFAGGGIAALSLFATILGIASYYK
jgi:hypothetical protein